MKKSYNEYCYSETDCDTALGLSCNGTQLDSTGPIPVNENFCDCTRVSNNESFWNGSKCTPALGYNQTCSATYMCKTLTEDSICSGSCVCDIGQYYNSSRKKCDLLINCPRVSNNETYWNGSMCVSAGAYGNKCSNNYQCQVLTQSLKCDTITSKCSCEKSIWKNDYKKCIPCASGWIAYNNSCYKSAYLSISSFSDVKQSDISAICNNPASSNVSLAEESDFQTSQASWITTNICTNPDYKIHFFGPVINAKKCACFDSKKSEFSTHDCDHGESHHAIICKYV